MKTAIYGNSKEIEEFVVTRNSDKIAFCVEDIELGRRLEKEGKGTFYTCYLRMAEFVEDGTYICLKEIPQPHVISLFERGIYVIFANDFYTPAPVASYDNSYLFELEKISELINEKGSSFDIMKYSNQYVLNMIELGSLKLEINKHSCAILGKNISRLFRFGYTYDNIIDFIDENPAFAMSLIMHKTTQNKVDIDKIIPSLEENHKGQPFACTHDLQIHTENVASITKEIIKYFQEN